MLDFVQVCSRYTRNGCEVYPKFLVRPSKDLMIRGGDFYAIWDGYFWSSDENRAVELIDNEIRTYYNEHPELAGARILYLYDGDSGMIDKWHHYTKKQLRDRFHELDSKLIFLDQEVTREDYATKKLPYNIGPGDYSAWNELIGTLYSEDERHKIEWAIGCILSGDSVFTQKFVVLYGSAGTGKSTILNIIEMLFAGYFTAFNSKSLGERNNQFALESFKTNPLVAIQHDGDLSKIKDNTLLNSLVSHELMVVNEKFKSMYQTRFRSFLFMGTNKTVEITDTKSGLLRRLIDVSPTGNKVPQERYNNLMAKIPFELGAIAQHCLDIYEEMPDAYSNYIPTAMMSKTNALYNYIMTRYDELEKLDETTLTVEYSKYSEYMTDGGFTTKMDRVTFKNELCDYFDTFTERKRLPDGTRIRNLYSGFVKDKFQNVPKLPKRVERTADWLHMGQYKSIFDICCSGCYAQYGTNDEREKPITSWDNVTTTLKNLDTSMLHYVRVPENHIVIDFDIKDANGKKSLTKNLQAAAKWPPTYAELSKSGQGIHLHYIYTGDVKRLSAVFDENIEVKVFTGKSSLRRRLTACNEHDISEISSGLPLKEKVKDMIDIRCKDAETLKRRIIKNLHKEYHANTAPSVDFIKKLLDDAYEDGIIYDFTSMKPYILQFAMSSTNQAQRCVDVVNTMKFKSKDFEEQLETREKPVDISKPIVFVDCEVFPNLFLVNYKFAGRRSIIRMINPKPIDIEKLLEFRLVGFNNRKYDNHMLWGCMMGLSNEGLFNLSQRLIDKKIKNAGYGEAYEISYTDIYDFTTKKQSLKKWEIELGIHHKELGLPWDKPVPPERWEEVAEYCDNDVIATEAVWEHCQGDFIAREILADLADMSVNTPTNKLTTRIIFGHDKHPQSKFKYRFMGNENDICVRDENDPYTAFTSDGKPIYPGYLYFPMAKKGEKSVYRSEYVGEGGYVDSNVGMYGPVTTLDVASMHPSSIIAEELFGIYTARFKALVDARIAIKHKDYECAQKIIQDVFGKDISKYLDDPTKAKALAQALKIAINSVYGLTAATFECEFHDPNNIDNIVAKRGALFMINLKHLVEERGYKVVHIKTDSIKIENLDNDIYEFVLAYGKRYGYNFEIEHKFEKLCLINDAVYIGKLAEDDPEHPGAWEATGEQFAVPYVFKTLFSKEPIDISDLCETKSVTTALYLDMNEKMADDEHDLQFVGKVGLFSPIKPGYGGGELVRENKDKEGNLKYDSANGAKGYRWLESENVTDINMIDISYYRKQVDDAIEVLSKYGDVSSFLD